jgi:hypothetical protein
VLTETEREQLNIEQLHSELENTEVLLLEESHLSARKSSVTELKQLHERRASQSTADDPRAASASNEPAGTKDAPRATEAAVPATATPAAAKSATKKALTPVQIAVAAAQASASKAAVAAEEAVPAFARVAAAPPPNPIVAPVVTSAPEALSANEADLEEARAMQHTLRKAKADLEAKAAKVQHSTDSTNGHKEKGSPKMNTKDSPKGAGKKKSSLHVEPIISSKLSTPDSPRPRAMSTSNSTASAAITDENSCVVCVTKVYPMERLQADGSVYHKKCFRCAECNKVRENRLDSPRTSCCVLRLTTHSRTRTHTVETLVPDAWVGQLRRTRREVVLQAMFQENV